VERIVSNDAQEEFMSWSKRQGLFISIFGFTAVSAIFGAMWAWIRGRLREE
jgi:hypothetical protein